MPTPTHKTSGGGSVSDLPVSQIFDLLAHGRRRRIIQYLQQGVGAVHISDVADQVALWEGEHTREHYERICTGLIHVHLPKLADANVVQYNPDTETVALLQSADQLRPYLSLAAASETQ